MLPNFMLPNFMLPRLMLPRLHTRLVHRIAVSLSVLLAALVAAPGARCEDPPARTQPTLNWPRFRGADGTGVSADDPRLPERWSETENVLWQTPVPGWGWSSPVVWGNKVFLTSVESAGDYEKPKAGLYQGQGRKEIPDFEHTWWVSCLDVKTGVILWKNVAHKGRPTSPRHPKNTYASETPATDGERLYTLFGDVGLYCHDLEGNLLWELMIEPRKTFFDYGAAGSPVVHDGQVIMVYDNMEASYIASYDARTGQERWRAPRKELSTWATPLVWKNDRRGEVVVSGRERILSYSLEGKVLWELGGKMSNLIIPSPLASHGMVYVASGYVGDADRPVFAIKAGASGDITLPEGKTSSELVAWHLPTGGPYNTSPIVYGPYYYTLFDRGFLTAHDALTGAEVYGKTRLPPGSSFTSSPWAYNGKLFCLSEEGDTYVIQAGKEFKLLQTNSLNDLCLASPAACQGKLFLRTASKLYCLTNETKP